MTLISQVPNEPGADRGTRDKPAITLALADDLQLIPDRAPRSPENDYHHGARPYNHERRRRTGSLRRQLAAGDVVALGACWGAQAMLHNRLSRAHELAFGAVAVLVTLVAMQRGGLYRSRVCALRSLEIVRVTVASAIGTAAFIALVAAFATPDIARALIVGAVSSVAVLLLR